MDKQTILVVDDTSENIDILVNALSDEYVVKAVKNGKNAIRLIESSLPDMILLDIMMPDMNGYELCQLLKGNVETMHIPVIFITALSDEDDELRGFEIGAVDYITKPISVPIVKARVKAHIELNEWKQLQSLSPSLKGVARGVGGSARGLITKDEVDACIREFEIAMNALDL